MYNAKVGSPTTVITANLTAGTTTIPVQDIAALTTAPGLATLLDGAGNQEVILYTGISGNDLTGVTRGFEGDARTWATGTFISRRLTAHDVNSLQTNLNDHNTQHETGGTDAINLAGLAGESAELATHKADYASKFPDSAGAHNSIYRGKYLGTSYTPAQKAAIDAGTFVDLYIGDYWTIGGVNYRIAGFDYFKNVGDTALTAPHAVIVPDTVLYSAAMNATNITTGGYVGSLMRTVNLAAAITTIETAFGAANVLSHNQILVNATTDGKASGWAWTAGKVELMNEVMVYGTGAWGVSSFGNGHNVATSNGRLPLFNFRQDLVNTRQSYWLRDVVSATDFAGVSGSGVAGIYGASGSVGVRPAFSIS